MKKIYLIYNPHQFDQTFIRTELMEEGYDAQFAFGNDVPHEESHKYIREADEVWVWGSCEQMLDYQIAESLGADIWIMG